MEQNNQLEVSDESSENQAMNTYMQEQQQQMSKDLEGLKVTFWDGEYAESLLQAFFPVESNRSIDFTLQD